MNVLMLTNTYLPHVGGVARSVAAFSEELRNRGHKVLIIAPDFDGQPEHEEDVVRLPAIQNFNGSDFSVVLPNFGALSERLDDFLPEIVHAHHPYLLGMTALRIARFRMIPLLFTHHTRYEQYTHYVPGDSPVLRQFAIELASRYANLTDHVIAPSESIRKLLIERKVETAITVIPTGVQVERFVHGDDQRFRKFLGIPNDAFVVGHLGRLAPEKNLAFLAEAIGTFLGRHEGAHFLLAGQGPAEHTVMETLSRQGVGDRLHRLGTLAQKQDLADAYHSMNVFAFASKTETQGMVLTEAMAAGVPVVALDAPGARDVLKDRVNGYLCQEESCAAFSAGLEWVYALTPAARESLASGARSTADEFSLANCTEKLLGVYEELCSASGLIAQTRHNQWPGIPLAIKAELDILASFIGALSVSLEETYAPSQH